MTNLSATLPGAAFVTGAAFVLVVVVWCAVRALRARIIEARLDEAAEDERRFPPNPITGQRDFPRRQNEYNTCELEDGEFDVRGNIYRNCWFERCTLVYDKTTEAFFEGCFMTDVKWRFADSDKITLEPQGRVLQYRVIKCSTTEKPMKAEEQQNPASLYTPGDWNCSGYSPLIYSGRGIDITGVVPYRGQPWQPAGADWWVR